MKKVFLNILSLAFVLTTIAFVMDGDIGKTKYDDEVYRILWNDGYFYAVYLCDLFFNNLPL